MLRATGDGEAVRLTPEPLKKGTWVQDVGVDLTKSNTYTVRTVVQGGEANTSKPCVVKANSPARNYLSIPLKTQPGHTPNDCAVGDLDGDGDYEIVVKQEMRPRDNSQSGTTGETKLEAYKLDGTFLWRINLGKNIREGAHYT